MIRSIVSPLRSSVAACTIIAVSICIAYMNCDSGWVASSGAMITLFGILLTTRVLHRNRSTMAVYQSQNLDIASLPTLPDESVSDPENEKKIEDQRKEKAEKLLDIKSQKYGFWFLIVGTIIWAYGDRLFNLVCLCCE